MDNKLKTFFKKQFLSGKKGAFTELPEIDGVQISTSDAKLYKNKKRKDLSLFYFDKGAKFASAFTKSKAAAECIKWNKKIKSGKVKALFVNTKNANALTGKQGFDSLKELHKNISKFKKMKQNEILFASTGVIGEKFPIEKIKNNIPHLVKNLKSSNKQQWISAAKAIMTTDTIAKLSKSSFTLDKKKIHLAGITKGSGMIAPNMATMLAFVFTNACISKNLLNKALKENLEKTFNAISVDADTSTNDMVLVFSTDSAKNKLIDNENSKSFKLFKEHLYKVMLSLAHQITFDGEGSSKFIEINVKNAKTKSDAKTVGFSIANSQLCKTAIAGEDPNWGRIIMAVGKTEVNLDVNKINLKLGNQFIFKKGQIQKSYKESIAAKYMKGCHIKIEVDLCQGKSDFKVYTCDLTHEYISINADYRN